MVAMGIGGTVGALACGYFCATNTIVGGSHWAVRGFAALIGGVAGVTIGGRVALIAVKLTMKRPWGPW